VRMSVPMDARKGRIIQRTWLYGKVTTMSKKILHWIGNDTYQSEGGIKVSREYGDTPCGNKLHGQWVLRNSKGEFKDFDQYRYDLAERDHLELR